MIGFIRGILTEKSSPILVIDVQGVGYEINAPTSTFFDLPEVGVEIRILTHLIVREDQHTLYGFASERERILFRDLLKVSGVGAKMALAVGRVRDSPGGRRRISPPPGQQRSTRRSPTHPGEYGVVENHRSG